MARPRRKKKKPGFLPTFKLSPKTKKRLVRASLLINLLLLVFFIFALRRDGAALTFRHLGHFISAPFSELQQPPALPAPRKPVEPPKTVRADPPPAQVTPKPVPIPPTAGFLSETKPKLVFVIDDMGHTLRDLDILRDLGSDVTYAILPHLAYSKYFGRLSTETGAEVILHQPFEAKDGTIPGPGLITDRMTAEQALNVLSHSLADIPNHRGINNHMGSRGTSNPVLMTPILQEIKRRNLFFLDSMTSPKSVGRSVARQIGLPALKRDVFLDNVDEPEAIRSQIRSMASIARKKGYAVGIGHYHHKTLLVLREEIAKLKSAGFEIVSLGELIQYLQKKKAL